MILPVREIGDKIAAHLLGQVLSRGSEEFPFTTLEDLLFAATRDVNRRLDEESSVKPPKSERGVCAAWYVGNDIGLYSRGVAGGAIRYQLKGTSPERAFAAAALVEGSPPPARTPPRKSPAAGQTSGALTTPMNERQQSHITYFLERVGYRLSLKREYWAARMLAARDADHVHPLRTEEEGSEVFDYLRRLEEEQAAVK